MGATAPLFREPVFDNRAYHERRAWISFWWYIVILVGALVAMISVYATETIIANEVADFPLFTDYTQFAQWQPRCTCENTTVTFADFVTFQGTQISQCYWDTYSQQISLLQTRKKSLTLTQAELDDTALLAKRLSVIDIFINDTCRMAALVVTQSQIQVISYNFQSSDLLSEHAITNLAYQVSENAKSSVATTLGSLVEFGRVMTNVNSPVSMSNIYGNSNTMMGETGEIFTAAYPSKHLGGDPKDAFSQTPGTPKVLRIAFTKTSIQGGMENNDILMDALRKDIATMLYSSSRKHVMDILQRPGSSLLVLYRPEPSDTPNDCSTSDFAELRSVWPDPVEATLMYCDTQISTTVTQLSKIVISNAEPDNINITFTITSLSYTAYSAANKIKQDYSREYFRSLIAGVLQIPISRIYMQSVQGGSKILRFTFIVGERDYMTKSTIISTIKSNVSVITNKYVANAYVGYIEDTVNSVYVGTILNPGGIAYDHHHSHNEFDSLQNPPPG
eukprot:PhF_6_TR12655/c1_g1_i2/m.20111